MEKTNQELSNFSTSTGHGVKAVVSNYDDGTTDITIHNINNFFEGYYNLAKHRIGRSEKHIAEQAEYRAFRCMDCSENPTGKCLGCGCNAQGMFFAPQKEDPKKRWGKMMKPSDWLKFKKVDPNYKAFLKHKETYEEQNVQDQEEQTLLPPENAYILVLQE